jgi:hypothetical protein
MTTGVFVKHVTHVEWLLRRAIKYAQERQAARHKKRNGPDSEPFPSPCLALCQPRGHALQEPTTLSRRQRRG